MAGIHLGQRRRCAGPGALAFAVRGAQPSQQVGESRGVSRAREFSRSSRVPSGGWAPGLKTNCALPPRAGSRSDALDRVLPSHCRASPGKDVHRINGLLDLASADETWWPCGIAMLSEDREGSTALTEQALRSRVADTPHGRDLARRPTSTSSGAELRARAPT